MPRKTRQMRLQHTLFILKWRRPASASGGAVLSESGAKFRQAARQATLELVVAPAHGAKKANGKPHEVRYKCTDWPVAVMVFSSRTSESQALPRSLTSRTTPSSP